MERLEDQSHDVAHFLIWIEHDLAGLPTEIPGGNWDAKLASTSFLKFPLE